MWKRGRGCSLPLRAGCDQLLLDIADYTLGYTVSSKDAIKTARYAVLDSVGAQWMFVTRQLCNCSRHLTPPGFPLHIL